MATTPPKDPKVAIFDSLIPSFIIGDMGEQIQAFAAQYALNIMIQAHPDRHPDRNAVADMFKLVSAVRDELEIDAIWMEALRRRQRQLGVPTTGIKEVQVSGIFEPRRERLAHVDPTALLPKAVQAKLLLKNQHAACIDAVETYLQRMVEGKPVAMEKYTEEIMIRNLSAFPTPASSIVVRDGLLNIVTQALYVRENPIPRGAIRWAIRSERGIPVSSVRKYEYAELVVRPDGLIDQYPITQVQYNISEESVPDDIPMHWRSWDGKRKPPNTGYAYYFRRTGAAPEPFTAQIIGSIQLANEIDNGSVSRYWHQQILPPEPDHEDLLEVVAGYTLQRFRPLLPYLSPFIRTRRPLVALDLTAAEPRFRIFDLAWCFNLLGESGELHPTQDDES